MHARVPLHVCLSRLQGSAVLRGPGQHVRCRSPELVTFHSCARTLAAMCARALALMHHFYSSIVAYLRTACMRCCRQQAVIKYCYYDRYLCVVQARGVKLHSCNVTD